MRRFASLKTLFTAALCSAALMGCQDTEDPTGSPTLAPQTPPGFPKIVITPNPVDFGDVLIYGEGTKTVIVTIRNEGDGLLYLGDLDIVYDGDEDGSTQNFRADFPDEDSLGENEEVNFAVIFDPAAGNYYNGIMRVESSDEGNRVLDVDLLGNGWRGTDADGDDVTVEEGDCNDDDASIYPGADEVCNLIDNDCDEIVDEGFDVDGDGYTECDDPADCDDSDATVNPGADELCDGQDNDCDTLLDEGFDADEDGSVDCADDDGDGYSEDGAVGGEADCDDQDPTTYPGAPELCDGLDNDCDGVVDNDPDDDGIGGSDCLDDDGDGQSEEEGDCNDDNPDIYDGAPEQCDFLDNDCDANIDEGTDLDEDSDGFTACDGDCNNNDATVYPGATEVCDLQDNDCDTSVDEGHDADVDGYAYCAGDCADDNPTINPGVDEICDGIDNNCNEQVDEGFDEDGLGGADCVDNDGDGQSEDDGDCDDGDDTTYDGADELCDEVDNDCDSSTDEGASQVFYGDGDKDDYGVDSITYEGCEAPAGYASQSGDCNDANDAIYPGAPEQCNGVDDDCDSAIDEGSDEDGDGFFVCGGETDCNDQDADINPDATEVCDGVDNNCNAQIDEGFDSDGSGGSDCVDNDGDGQTEDEGDCDDTDDGAYTGGTETCDNTDNDCDSSTDEGVRDTYYDDADSDGYGDPATSTSECSAPAGTVSNATDCDDDIAAVNPGATEVCNDRDDDCDSQTDEGFDADNDGYATCENDCDDNDPDLYPGQTETCNGADEDCDDIADEGFDIDGDGVADCNASDDDGDGYSEDQYDCDDTDPNIYPITVDASFSGTADGSVNKPYRKIQVGLDNCQTCPYVWVRPATYYENVSWPSYDAWLLSVEGTSNTFINGSTGTDATVSFEQAGLSDSRIDGFTIRNGSGRVSGSVSNGGGIYITVSSPTIQNNVITNNTVTGSGGGIYVTSGATPVIRNNVIKENKVDTTNDAGYGGGLYLNGTLATVTLNTFNENEAPRGGGMAARNLSGSPMVLEDNIFTNNTAFDAGADGSSGAGGGLYTSDANVVVQSSRFEGNYADIQGGGFYYDDGGDDDVITDNEFIDNVAGDNTLLGGVEYRAGGLMVRDADPDVHDNFFEGNIADEAGGALYLRNTDSAVFDNEFTGNTSLDGGAVTGYSYGGSLRDNLITNNEAWDDGAGLFCYLCDGEIYDNTITANTAAGSGGGLYTLDGTEVYRTNTFTNNQAVLAGGAYFFRGTVLFTENHVEGNIAVNEGGSGRGGGLMLSSSEASIVANAILNNSATGSRGSGAGIRIENSPSVPEVGNVRLANNVIQGNISYRGAGISFEELTEGIVENNTLVENSTTSGDFSEGAGIYIGLDAAPQILNNIIGYSALGEGIHVYKGEEPISVDPIVEYNAFYQNQGDDVGGRDYTPGAGNLYDNSPQFDNLNADYGDDDFWTLKSSSPCINAGKVGPTYTDMDGSRNDMGAYGGPDAVLP